MGPKIFFGALKKQQKGKEQLQVGAFIQLIYGSGGW